MNETPTLTTRDEWLVLIGYEAGREDGKAVTAILTDLIADLREVHTTPTRGLVPLPGRRRVVWRVRRVAALPDAALRRPR